MDFSSASCRKKMELVVEWCTGGSVREVEGCVHFICMCERKEKREGAYGQPRKGGGGWGEIEFEWLRGVG